jgi:hypothetical protein
LKQNNWYELELNYLMLKGVNFMFHA